LRKNIEYLINAEFAESTKKSIIYNSAVLCILSVSALEMKKENR